MSDGPFLRSGQTQPGQPRTGPHDPVSSFGARGFGPPVSEQLQNPFQQAPAQNQPQNQNWYTPAPLNGPFRDSGNAWSGNGSASQPANQPPNSAFSAFSAHQSPPFGANTASAFANVAAQPFGSDFTTAAARGQGFPGPQAPQLQDQTLPRSAFTTIPSSAAPVNATGDVQPRDTNVKSKQLAQKLKRQGRKDRNDANSRSQAGVQAGAGTQVQSQAKQQRGTSEFPHFAPTPFPSVAHPASDDLSLLKPLPRPLTSIQERKDVWDAENQQQLEHIEGEYLEGKKTLQEAYDIMNGMREKERREMEKRGLVDSVQARKSLDDAIAFVGSCTDMCPVYERVRRALENNALGWEKGGNNKVIASRAVKAFARPAAGNPPALPSDVRPPRILVNTLRYLVTEMMPKLPESHAFLWDRTRSIRQDFTFQNFQGPEATWCLEVIARIHVVCLHTMAHAASNGMDWSQQQELEQFNKCLQSLSEFYQESPTDNEPEMRAYGVLSHLFDEELVASVDRLPLQVSRHPLLVLALDLRTLALTSVTEFFIRVRKPDVPATFRSILEIHYNELRMRGVRNLASSLHRRTNMYPIRRFVSLLGFETDDQARQFADFYDLTISTSDEAGEEIDVKAWSEENVRDKRRMAQSFDYSLDPLIGQLDVTKPLQIPVNGTAQTSTVSRLLDQHKPKFNVAAPSFKPTVQHTKPTALSNQQSLVNSGNQRVMPAPNGPIKFGFDAATPRRDSALEQSQSFVPQTSVPKATVSLPVAPPPEGISRGPNPRSAFKLGPDVEARFELPASSTASSQAPPQKTLPSKPSVPDHTIQSVLTGVIKAEVEEVLRHARLKTQRSRFVDSVSRQTLDTLLSSVTARDTAMILKAVEYNRQRLKKFVIHTIKKKAARSLSRKLESERQEQELRLFWARPPTRVVSQRRSQSTPLVSQSPEPTEPKDDMINYDQEEEDASMTDDQMEPFSFLPIIPLFRKAYSSGLSTLGVIIDSATKQGRWIQNVVGTGAVRVEVLPHRVVVVNVVGPEAETYDVCLYGDGVQRPHSIVAQDISGLDTLLELEKAFITAVRNWLVWHENDLLHYRSLNVVNVKRRRVSHPTSSFLDSACNSTADSLLTAQHSFATHTNERARLRALVADARSLMK